MPKDKGAAAKDARPDVSGVDVAAHVRRRRATVLRQVRLREAAPFFLGPRRFGCWC